jgi:hypothetical protein
VYIGHIHHIMGMGHQRRSPLTMFGLTTEKLELDHLRGNDSI